MYGATRLAAVSGGRGLCGGRGLAKDGGVAKRCPAPSRRLPSLLAEALEKETE